MQNLDDVFECESNNLNDYAVKQFERNVNRCAQASLLCANRSVNNKKQEESFVEAFQAKVRRPINLKKKKKKEKKIEKATQYGAVWQVEARGAHSRRTAPFRLEFIAPRRARLRA